MTEEKKFVVLDVMSSSSQCCVIAVKNKNARDGQEERGRGKNKREERSSVRTRIQRIPEVVLVRCY